MKIKQADVAIIIPCYDLEKYLGECIDSIRAQTVQPKEIIIIHDGCKAPKFFNGCEMICRSFNRGVAYSRDEGAKNTKAKYILFVDADDALREDFIEESLKIDADIVYPRVFLWSRWGGSKYYNAMFEPDKNITLKKLLAKNEIVVTSLIKRTVYDKVGGFDESLPIFEDWDFFVRANIKGFTMQRSETYLKYRQRMDSRNRQSEEIRSKTFGKVRDKYIAYLKKSK
jgi:glycosyltransferase involved in cell wall biosynthesis